MSVHVFGIRHHGPGCARSLVAALDALQPDAVLIEGPADAQPVVSRLAQPGFVPPVALLVYPPDAPRSAVYFPLTEYSPEWQTLQWCLRHDITPQFMDLAQTHQIALRRAADKTPTEPEPRDAPGDAESEPAWRTDPLAVLASAAGYEDHELWWEEQIERRADAADLFAAILEAMHAVRAAFPETGERDLLREAFMRKTVRAAVKSGSERTAVVCGAWHAPVLDEDAIHGKRDGCRRVDDTARLKGLPKVKTQATWIPWTYSRMTFASGYGAGVSSPGWYERIWHARERAPAHWLATAARLLRAADLEASSASVIEALRLAETLAALRELRAPGLAELNEAILAIFCHGDPAPVRLIEERLVVGDVLGRIPDDGASVPLARDLEQRQRSVRLKPSTESRLVDLDLRKPNGLGRSHLLHSLNVLEIPWGRVQESGSRVSTFHEVWSLQWQPEFAVQIIEANVWGNTVEAAATARLIHEGQTASELVALTDRLDCAMLAGLSDAIPALLQAVQAQAAVSADVRHLLEALLPLARIARYGDVRGTQTSDVRPVLESMFARALVGLLPACSALDDEAAERMRGSMSRAQQALGLLDDPHMQADWLEHLHRLARSDEHGLLRGWCCRVLLEQGQIDAVELARLTALALSPANPTGQAAAWISGFLRGSGLLLLQQNLVWQVMDRWLSRLSAEAFLELLPVLRRAFADFQPPERRRMAEKLKQLPQAQGAGRDAQVDGQRHEAAGPSQPFDRARARRTFPVLAQILGIADRSRGGEDSGQSEDSEDVDVRGDRA